MKKVIPIPLILILILNFACASKKTIVNNPTNQSRETYPEAKIGEFHQKNDPYKINSIKIEGNYIIIEISYSGGCETHQFDLIGSKLITKSKPTIRNLQLVHDNKGDICKALITEKLKFSISILAENYAPGNFIKLQFENYSPILEYSYE